MQTLHEEQTRLIEALNERIARLELRIEDLEAGMPKELHTVDERPEQIEAELALGVAHLPGEFRR